MLRRQSSASISLNVEYNPPKFKPRRSFLSKDRRPLTHIWNYTEGPAHLMIPMCTFCHMDFRNNLEWQAHMITYVHKVPSPTPAEIKRTKEEALIICRICGQDVIIHTVKEHRCLVAELARLEGLLEQYNLTYCPTVCILCRKLTAFSSQAILQLHLITRHSITRDPWRCNICSAKFTTTCLIVHEAHMVDVHGPELNLIHWKAMGAQSKGKLKNDSIRYVCALSHFSKFSKSKTYSCPDDMKDLFELTLHTLCYHGIMPKKPNLTRKENELLNKDSVACRYCGDYCTSPQQFTDHILTNHGNEIIIRKDFILRKGLFLKKISVNFTCFVCVSVFPTTVDLQVHLMVNHGTMEFGICGLCGEDLLNYNLENPNKIDRIHWKAINYHERLHVQQCLNYKTTGIFNPSLKEEPKIYKSDQDFADQLFARNNVQSGPMFTDKQVTFFTKLGKKNYDTQVNMEINDK